MEYKPKIPEEQLRYAKILDIGNKAGLLALVLSFIAYITGILPTHVPLSELPAYWKLPVHEYINRVGLQPGWSWIKLLNKGEFFNLLFIAFLIGLTTICYISIIPIFFRRKDTVYGILSIIEILILTLAAVGVLKIIAG